jgi:hypothetical protein
MIIRKISRLLFLVKLFLFVIIPFLSTAVFAEYYLVFSGPCSYCDGHFFKPLNYYSPKRHRLHRHHYCYKPHRHIVRRITVPKCYAGWIPGYWINGHWIPPRRATHVSRIRYHHYRPYRVSDTYYNLDLTTGDDNPYVDPDMNIDR